MKMNRRHLISTTIAFGATSAFGLNMTKSLLSAKLNAIANKNDKEEEMYKEMYLAMTTGISTFGDTLIDSISEKLRDRAFSNFPNTITHLVFNNVKSCGFYTFRDALYIQSVELPICTVIYPNSFTNCPQLKIVKAPNCRNLGANAFQSSSNLEHIYVNNIDFSNAQAFPWSISNSNTIFHFKDGNYDYQGNKIL